MHSDAKDERQVLIVDDDFVTLEVVSAIFTRAGLSVLSASSGEAALTLLRTHGDTIAWLLTDIRLPGLVDGWSVAAEFRRSYPDRPIIYASAQGYQVGLGLPGSLFIDKPFDAIQILGLAHRMECEKLTERAERDETPTLRLLDRDQVGDRQAA